MIGERTEKSGLIKEVLGYNGSYSIHQKFWKNAMEISKLDAAKRLEGIPNESQ